MHAIWSVRQVHPATELLAEGANGMWFEFAICPEYIVATDKCACGLSEGDAHPTVTLDGIRYDIVGSRGPEMALNKMALDALEYQERLSNIPVILKKLVGFTGKGL